MKHMVVGVICKEDNDDALSLAARVIERIKKKGLDHLYEDHIASHLGLEHKKDVWTGSELLIVIGGDGTLLRSIRLSARREIPILGIHVGFLGFLTEVMENEFSEALDAVLEGDYVHDERIMLKATLVRDDTIIASQLVLNDIVINKGALARIIDIEVWTNSTFITRYRADGLIVSTPTGSTAYNLSADGPIVHPKVPATILTPICPHVLSNRSIVLPDTQEVILKVNTEKKADHIFLTLDGQMGYPLEPGDKIFIKRGDLRAIMVRFTQRDYFEVLRTKLKWQEI